MHTLERIDSKLGKKLTLTNHLNIFVGVPNYVKELKTMQLFHVHCYQSQINLLCMTLKKLKCFYGTCICCCCKRGGERLRHVE